MKRIITRTLAASVLILTAQMAQAIDAPGRTECFAPAKPGGKVRFSATVAWGKRLEPWLVTLAGSARED